MHLQRIRTQNFGKTSPQLDWILSRGLNIRIGENDAGKTAVISVVIHERLPQRLPLKIGALHPWQRLRPCGQ